MEWRGKPIGDDPTGMKMRMRNADEDEDEKCVTIDSSER